jgi:hypothetical protein
MLFPYCIDRRILFGDFLFYQKVVEPVLREHSLHPSTMKKPLIVVTQRHISIISI